MIDQSIIKWSRRRINFVGKLQNGGKSIYIKLKDKGNMKEALPIWAVDMFEKNKMIDDLMCIW